jgi:hypothetical protein
VAGEPVALSKRPLRACRLEVLPPDGAHQFEMSVALADEGSMPVRGRHDICFVCRHENERYAVHRKRIGDRKAGLESEVYVQTGDVDHVPVYRL